MGSLGVRGKLGNFKENENHEDLQSNLDYIKFKNYFFLNKLWVCSIYNEAKSCSIMFTQPQEHNLI